MDIINYRNFEDTLRSEGQYVTTLNGSSMFPMVRHGVDPVLIVPADGPLKRYDVAVYSKPDRYVVHRVLGFRDGVYIIRGDNCVTKEYVPEDKISGRVSGFWRKGRFIPVTDRRYKAYAKFWVAINPLVRIHHFIQKVVRHLHRSKI